MDPALAEQWMADGLLPNFSHLAATGRYQHLGTTNPAQSPVAWASFATGHNPGEHNIFDFIRRNATDYSPDFSISKIEAPNRSVGAFGYQIPLDKGAIINRRKGEPFWMAAEKQGQRASVLRVPVTFPPDPVHRMLSGMGVPDLLGTQGTYTLFTTDFTRSSAIGGRVVRVHLKNGVVDTSIEGPTHPLKSNAEPLTTSLKITKEGKDSVWIEVGDARFKLKSEQWSDWVPLEYRFAGVMSVQGMVRFYLVKRFSGLSLYVSPINIDPRNPAVPISSPPEYAAELADKIGLYHTLGMPEETWSLNEKRIPDEAYLEMVRQVLAEREAMLFDTLSQKDSELVVAVFVQTDRISHMFWRGLDKSHPLYGESSEAARGAIQWIYQEADRILGKTLDQLNPEDRLIVLSDHGFSSFRRAINLNRWLVDQGYLVLKPGQSEASMLFSQVDWTHSRAYALGLNGVFINEKGRESQGIVEQQDIPALKQELMAQLTTLVDSDNGEQAITRVYDKKVIYRGSNASDAPDIVIGYAPGYRASWETVLGAIPEALMYTNTDNWSGDHCIDPSHVPGVLFTSFKPEQPVTSIQDIRRLIDLTPGEKSGE
jgi:predicted AlkP superfamily phosphohydrolase/phosphomutase